MARNAFRVSSSRPSPSEYVSKSMYDRASSPLPFQSYFLALFIYSGSLTHLKSFRGIFVLRCEIRTPMTK